MRIPLGLRAAAGAQVAGNWIATLGGASTGEYWYGVGVDSSGNVYAAGEASQNASDCLIAKYNAAGVIQWQRSLGDASIYQSASAIAVDSSGNAHIVGYASNSGNIVVAKYNSSGTIQWQRTLNGSADDYGAGITVDSSGNVYITGYTASQGAGDTDALIVKYNSSGTLQWQRSLGGTSSDSGTAIAIDSSGNVYIAGYTRPDPSAAVNCLLAKYDSSGTIQWQRSLGEVGADLAYGVAVDSSSNVYICGYTNSQGAGSDDLLVAKYNSSGTLQWQRSLGGASNEYGQGIAVDSSNNVYVTGGTNSQGAGGNDFLIAKYNSSGTIQWQRSLGTTGANYGNAIAVDNSGNIYVAGYTSGNANDALIAKLPDDGSKTGTYGSFVYAATTLTDAARTLTSATTSLTDAARTLTDAAGTLTDASTSFTSTTTTL